MNNPMKSDSPAFKVPTTDLHILCIGAGGGGGTGKQPTKAELKKQEDKLLLSQPITISVNDNLFRMSLNQNHLLALKGVNRTIEIITHRLCNETLSDKKRVKLKQKLRLLNSIQNAQLAISANLILLEKL